MCHILLSPLSDAGQERHGRTVALDRAFFGLVPAHSPGTRVCLEEVTRMFRLPKSLVMVWIVVVGVVSLCFPFFDHTAHPSRTGSWRLYTYFFMNHTLYPIPFCS